MLKAIIFDMDGVIVDSEPLHAMAAQRTVASFGITLPQQYFLQFVGSTTKHMFDTIIRDYNLSTTTEELLAMDKANCKALYAEKGRIPVPGAIELIKELHSHGLKLAIASSSTFEQIQVVVDEFKLNPYFTCLSSGAALGKPKPAPDVFLEALRLLDVSPKEAIVIEDSKNGVLASNAASIACVGYLNPHSGKQDLYLAAVVTDSLSALNAAYLQQVLDRVNHIPLTIKETKRLTLRELSLEDIPTLYEMYQNKEVCCYIPSLSSLEEELEKQKTYIENVYPFYGYGLWGVFDKRTKQLIGQAGIENKMIDGMEELELSYLIDYEHWNLGYATEACRAIIMFAIEELEATRLVSVIAKENIASVQVVKKLGMELEKELNYQGFNCFLYSIDLNEQRKCLHATKNVTKLVKPDTNVYSKRYQ